LTNQNPASAVPDFHVVPGVVVSDILGRGRDKVMDAVREAYLLHEKGESVNPDSYFLQFPDDPKSRVIALPARIGGDVRRIGVKWISSFPRNTASGIPRASAVLVLNDYDTGYPVACLESAGISAARTAASAAIAAQVLQGYQARFPLSLSFVGAGVIARTILRYLSGALPWIERLSCFDIDQDSAGHLAAYGRQVAGTQVDRCSALEEALGADIVVFATTAAEPYVSADTRFRPDQLILHISLRDLAPQILLGANNVVDDVDHCLKAGTSPHLAEQLSGSREFVTGTLGSALGGGLRPDPGLPIIFSPFGLGILDIAVGELVLREALSQGRAIPIPGFFGETSRW
jgi:N-[(2S)-2-amino-2-carboxyethyl]-L-glutamate dehydrogenase